MAPSKTALAAKPARPISKYALPGTPRNRSSAPNKSILSFFQKVDPPEESMFVGGDTAPHAVQPVHQVHNEDDTYRADDDGPHPETRYNEEPIPNKRRRTSQDRDEVKETEAAAQKPPEPLAQIKPPNKPSPPKKPRKGPFLDDSDSEEEDKQSPVPAKVLEEAKSEAIRPQDKEEHKVGHTTNDKTVITPTAADVAEPSGTDLTSTLPPGPDINTRFPRLKHEASTTGDYGEFGDLQDELEEDLWEGEEMRAMRFMEEQARLEAEQESDIPNGDTGFETLQEDDAMTACCPICNTSLAGVSSDQATVHVNSCLDGNPTTLPSMTPTKLTPQSPKPRAPDREQDLVPAPEMSKRFARAAVARPGQANPISIGGGGRGEEGGTTKGKAGSSSAFSKLMSGHAEDAAWNTAAAAETASRGKPAYQRTCPFYKIMPGFRICVDAFRYGAVEGCRAYFLSHFHSDHYIGLTASWTHGPIYCSKVTGSLVKTQLKTAGQYVVELDFEEKVPVPGTDGVFVTMIPANHCPGSSLFLFEKAVTSTNPNAHAKEKKLQRILHCGDFRACPAHIEHPQLKPETVDALGKIKQQKIDICYLDTTYLNPRYSFPPQTDVIRACADLCFELDSTLRKENESQWHSVLGRREGVGAGNNDTVSRFFAPADKPPPISDSAVESNSPQPQQQPPSAVPDDNALSVLGRQARANRNRLLVVCGTYSIGKERICKAIAIALKSKIFASAAKIRICSQLGDPELAGLMTSNPYEAQVHMQMLMEIRAETLAEYLDQFRPHFGRVVGFRPSGWNYRPSMANNGGTSGAGAGHASSAAAAAGMGGGAAAATVTASTPPGSVPTTQILHGLSWRTRFGPRDLVPQRGSCKEAMCFGVPYSEHSSFRELMLFVMALRIEKVVPTVNVGSEPSRRRMKAWTDRWLSERRRGGVVRVVREDGDGGEDVLRDDGEADVDSEDAVEVGNDDESDGKPEKVQSKKQKSKLGSKEVVLWDGKDGRGGAVYW
ncbi:DNA repair metallo-beta-lactamase-domain-containing protein [Coniella lustricola]|uniref:DNA repair metallo-beta-lactamase-domain-containing protein n=1 Tax=Coniella lustricola TaxID=2025994 RepID=A0A2T3A3F0_9PEZI|nr:DNA repair metallo-beta-lactamase-domain-containing protein [Coniella lustricola]